MAQKNTQLPNQRTEQTTLSQRDSSRLKVTAYERSSSMLIALLILVGVVVSGVLTYYWTLQKETVAVSTINASPAGKKDLQEGIDITPEPPGEVNAPELDKPQISAALTSLTLTSERSAALADSQSKEQNETSVGYGPGDKRVAGDGDDDNTSKERVSREAHWEIKYVDVDINEYGRQLDFFGIELGVIDRKANTIHWAKNFSGTPQTGVRTSKETRKRGLLALTFSAGNLRRRDQQLVMKAGVKARGQIVQFFPRKVEDMLVFLELKKAGKGRSINDISHTYFEVRQKRDGYEIFVADQKYF